MEDQLLLSDNSDDDDDQAQGDELSSSSNMSDDEHSHRLPRSFLSEEDIDQCLYVTNINWRKRFSVSGFFLGRKEIIVWDVLKHTCVCVYGKEKIVVCYSLIIIFFVDVYLLFDSLLFEAKYVHQLTEK